jgi:hypothetical protein
LQASKNEKKKAAGKAREALKDTQSAALRGIVFILPIVMQAWL